MGYFTKIPLTATAAQHGDNDWTVRATVQKYSSFGLLNQVKQHTLLPTLKSIIFNFSNLSVDLKYYFQHRMIFLIQIPIVLKFNLFECFKANQSSITVFLIFLFKTPIIPRGKGPGGSGQINFLLHGFGLPEDYNRWSRLGFKGWTLDDLKPYFLKAFGTVKSEFDSENCPVKGICAKVCNQAKTLVVKIQNKLKTKKN